MKAAYLNPFIKSITDIIESSVFEKPACGRPFLRDTYPYVASTITIIVGVTGHLTGQVVISMPEDCAKRIAAKMMMEESIEELDEYANSAIAELGNMVAANATIGLNEAGFACDVTPPSVFKGDNVEISCNKKIKTIVIPVVLGVGDIEVNLSLMESEQLETEGVAK